MRAHNYVGWKPSPKRKYKHPRSKLSEEDVAAIRADRDAPLVQLAARFGVSPSTVYSVRMNRTYRQTAEAK